MIGKKIKKKAVVDKVFIYISSIIIVVFCGFLVSKFVFTFSKDVDSKVNIEFFEKLEKDYLGVYRTYGDEKVLKYKVHTDVELVCLVPSKDCLDKVDAGLSANITNYDLSQLEDLVETGDNVVLYDADDVMISKKIGDYTSLDGCFCVKPKQNKFDLLFQNIRNKVVIDVEN